MHTASTHSDTRSLGEESFPLLSTSASDGLDIAPGLSMATTERTDNRRSVRFAERLVRTHSTDKDLDPDLSENPSDENTDNASPTSVLHHLPSETDNPTIKATRTTALDTGGKPKSILRPGRFVGNRAVRTLFPPRRVVPLTLDPSLSSSDMATASAEYPTIAVAPPRDFCDTNGEPLSPIRSVQSLVAPAVASHTPPTTTTSKPPRNKTVEFDPSIMDQKVKRRDLKSATVLSNAALDDPVSSHLCLQHGC
jgi:hypothetical protein